MEPQTRYRGVATIRAHLGCGQCGAGKNSAGGRRRPRTPAAATSAGITAVLRRGQGARGSGLGPSLQVATGTGPAAALQRHGCTAVHRLCGGHRWSSPQRASLRRSNRRRQYWAISAMTQACVGSALPALRFASRLPVRGSAFASSTSRWSEALGGRWRRPRGTLLPGRRCAATKTAEFQFQRPAAPPAPYPFPCLAVPPLHQGLGR